MNTPRILFFFGIWLVVSLFCNDTTNYGAIYLGVNIRPDRIIYAVLILEFLRQYRWSGRKVPWILEEKFMVVFFLILLLSCFLFGAAFAPRNRYLSELFGFSFVPATLFIMSRRLTYDLRSLRVLWKALLTVGFYLGFTGVCEQYNLNALVFPKYILDPTIGIHFDRVRGPFVQAAMMGGAMIAVGLLILWYHFNIRKFWLNWVVCIALLASIYWTNTRGVWLQLAGSLAPLAVFRGPLRKAMRYFMLLAVVAYFAGIASKFSAYQTTLFGERAAQVDDRINIYHASWRMFLERPLLGFGYGNFLKYSNAYFEQLPGVELRGQGEGQHNTILGLMCETGIIGTIPYCLIYFLFFRTCYRRFRYVDSAHGQERSFALIQFALLSGTVVGMQFSDFGFYSYLNNLMFWTTAIAYTRFETATGESSLESSELLEAAVLKEPALAVM